jgi:hypothetical protein
VKTLLKNYLGAYLIVKPLMGKIIEKIEVTFKKSSFLLWGSPVLIMLLAAYGGQDDLI